MNQTQIDALFEMFGDHMQDLMIALKTIYQTKLENDPVPVPVTGPDPLAPIPVPDDPDQPLVRPPGFRGMVDRSRLTDEEMSYVSAYRQMIDEVLAHLDFLRAQGRPIRTVAHLPDVLNVVGVVSHEDRMNVDGEHFEPQYRNMSLLMGRRRVDDNVTSGVVWPASHDGEQYDAPPSVLEQAWNNATRRGMRRMNVPIPDWPLMLSPGHNPRMNASSPAILMMHPVTGYLKDFYEQCEVVMQFYEGHFSAVDINRAWNHAEQHHQNRTAVFNPDNNRRRSGRSPTPSGQLLAELGFLPLSPFPEI